MRPEEGADILAGQASVALHTPTFGRSEWSYVKECLDSGWVSSAGPLVGRFEQEVAARVNCGFGVAVTSGTAALHLALLVAGVQPEDEVLVSALTFVAPANAIRYVGAWPVFIDAEPEYWQMDAEKLASFLKDECSYTAGRLVNRTTGRRVVAILPVEILGHPCDMRALRAIADGFELPVIEDATESLGARYRGEPVGHLGHIACFSFNGNKIITTGGGGLVATDNEAWARRVRYLSTQARDDGPEYVHGEIGYNYRLSNIHAAIGIAQLERLEAHVAAKRALAARYADALQDVPGVSLPREAPWAFSVYWLYTVLIDEVAFGLDSRELLRRLAAHGIETRPLWKPLPTLRPFARCQAYRVEVADRLYQQALSLPSSPGLLAEDAGRVIDVIATVGRRAAPMSPGRM